MAGIYQKLVLRKPRIDLENTFSRMLDWARRRKGKKTSERALGCRLNQYEALALEGKLKEAGYEIVSFGDEADTGVINSCTVTREADAKSRNAIRRFFAKTLRQSQL